MIYKWHRWLDMPKKDRQWHEVDINDELIEYRTAKGLLMKWSEMGDVVYTYTRGIWGGYDLKFPLSKIHFVVGCIYMFPKMTIRYMFFRKAGIKAGTLRPLHEVRNPKKIHKLHHIADKYDLDRGKFQKICEEQLKYWILLP